MTFFLLLPYPKPRNFGPFFPSSSRVLLARVAKKHFALFPRRNSGASFGEGRNNGGKGRGRENFPSPPQGNAGGFLDGWLVGWKDMPPPRWWRPKKPLSWLCLIMKSSVSGIRQSETEASREITEETYSFAYHYKIIGFCVPLVYIRYMGGFGNLKKNVVTCEIRGSLLSSSLVFLGKSVENNCPLVGSSDALQLLYTRTNVGFGKPVKVCLSKKEEEST